MQGSARAHASFTSPELKLITIGTAKMVQAFVLGRHCIVDYAICFKENKYSIVKNI